MAKAFGSSDHRNLKIVCLLGTSAKNHAIFSLGVPTRFDVNVAVSQIVTMVLSMVLPSVGL